MYDKPPIQDADLIHFLQNEYGLEVAELHFLPLGADSNAAVYRVLVSDRTPYFLKLKRGDFDVLTLEMLNLFRAQNIPQIIPPLLTQTQQLLARFDPFNAILYPYIEGQDGFSVELSPDNWRDLGSALKQIHSFKLPPNLYQKLPQERYSPAGRDFVRAYQANLESYAFQDPIAAELIGFLKAERETIAYLVERAEALAATLKTESLEFVLCHADIHAGNVLIDESGKLFIVDWDEMILAPKERDLMFIGAGIGNIWNKPEEEALFWEGYGQTTIHRAALAYYRHERIVQDIAEFVKDIISDDYSAESRALMFRQLSGQFLPQSVVEMARKTALT